MTRARITVLTAALISLVPPSFADTFKLDPSHSSAQFSVKHMMISNVKGEFSNLSGVVEYDPQHVDKTRVDATIDVTTINTREPNRDKHLKSPDFFDVEKFPTMTFKSERAVEEVPGKIKLTGNLTLHGVTKEVTLDVEGPTKPITDMHGSTRIGASATTTVDRKDFGITWNHNMDGGGVVVGDQIPITLDIELVKQNKVAESK
ncbi:MAG TPA: YceI family protein [Planktothrix sp.]|jgi:polyisoprenoid-binding protein YceI